MKNEKLDMDHAPGYYDTDRNKPLPGAASKCATYATIIAAKDGEIAALTAEVTHLAEKVAERDALLVDIEFVITGAAPGSKLGGLLVRIRDFQRSADAPRPVDAAQAVPEGFALVPTTVTAKMQKAYFNVIDENMLRVQTSPHFGRWDNMALAYKAMIAAAPLAQPTDTTTGA